jgi:hypothetical protein
MSAECAFKWSELVTGQKQGTVCFPSANSCQGQLQTPQSVSVQGQYLNVSDQFSASGHTTPGERTLLLPNGVGRGVGHNGSGLLRERKNCCPCRAPNRGSPIIRTTLFRHAHSNMEAYWIVYQVFHCFRMTYTTANIELFVLWFAVWFKIFPVRSRLQSVFSSIVLQLLFTCFLYVKLPWFLFLNVQGGIVVYVRSIGIHFCVMCPWRWPNDRNISVTSL